MFHSLLQLICLKSETISLGIILINLFHVLSKVISSPRTSYLPKKLGFTPPRKWIKLMNIFSKTIAFFSKQSNLYKKYYKAEISITIYIKKSRQFLHYDNVKRNNRLKIKNFIVTKSIFDTSKRKNRRIKDKISWPIIAT